MSKVNVGLQGEKTLNIHQVSDVLVGALQTNSRLPLQANLRMSIDKVDRSFPILILQSSWTSIETAVEIA